MTLPPSNPLRVVESSDDPPVVVGNVGRAIDSRMWWYHGSHGGAVVFESGFPTESMALLGLTTWCRLQAAGDFFGFVALAANDCARGEA